MTSAEKNKKKKLLVDYFGGKCPCGEDHLACLHFHHIDPSTKKNDISKIMNRNWGYLLAEVKKCTLLCGNCHAKVHDGHSYHLPFTKFDETKLVDCQFNIKWMAKQAKASITSTRSVDAIKPKNALKIGSQPQWIRRIW